MEEREETPGQPPAAKPKKKARRKPADADAPVGDSARAPHKPRRKTHPLPAYNVVLLDDNDHTDTYVVEMLAKLFGHTHDRGHEMARQVTAAGRVIVLTTHKELAELKRDQILGYGADPRVESSKGSMTAVIEPAQSE